MNYLIGSDWQAAKAKKCDTYREALRFASKIATQSRRTIRSFEDYRDAMESLSIIMTLVEWDVMPGLNKRNLLDLGEAAKGNVTLKRIMSHEDPDKVYFLIMALMRGPDKPQPEKRSIKVDVRPERKSFLSRVLSTVK